MSARQGGAKLSRGETPRSPRDREARHRPHSRQPTGRGISLQLTFAPRCRADATHAAKGSAWLGDRQGSRCSEFAVRRHHAPPAAAVATRRADPRRISPRPVSSEPSLLFELPPHLLYDAPALGRHTRLVVAHDAALEDLQASVGHHMTHARAVGVEQMIERLRGKAPVPTSSPDTSTIARFARAPARIRPRSSASITNGMAGTVGTRAEPARGVWAPRTPVPARTPPAPGRATATGDG